MDIRAAVTYADTVLTNKITQVKFKSSAGFNMSLLRDGDKSLLEFKPYLEYNRILRNPLPDEKKDVFLANADIRIKISEQLWLPLTLKYDIEKENFLGFINISLNLDTFK